MYLECPALVAGLAAALMRCGEVAELESWPPPSVLLIQAGQLQGDVPQTLNPSTLRDGQWLNSTLAKRRAKSSGLDH